MILLREGLAPTPPALQAAERQWLAHLHAYEALWCGRGASALCFAYGMAALALSRAAPEVILPATGCASLASTALACGLVPRFADVDPSTGMPGLDDLKRVYTPKTCAVVYVHLFGNTNELRPIRDWCGACGIALIEDVAQALGAQLPSGEPAGSMGDLVVCSFSRTKLIECGGGALVIRSREFQALMARAASVLPAVSEPSAGVEDALETSYRDVQYGLTAVLRTGKARNLAASFLPLQRYYGPLWMRPLDSAPLLAERFADLPRSLMERRVKAGIYAAELDGGPWHILNGWSRSGVCWRFTLLLDEPGCQAPLAKAVRRDGFDVSNLYWPLPHFFTEDDAAPHAERFARRVMNLWVDDSVGHDRVRACARSILRHVREVCG